MTTVKEFYYIAHTASIDSSRADFTRADFTRPCLSLPLTTYFVMWIGFFTTGNLLIRKMDNKMIHGLDRFGWRHKIGQE